MALKVKMLQGTNVSTMESNANTWLGNNPGLNPVRLAMTQSYDSTAGDTKVTIALLYRDSS